jgi:hypothetical protein
MFIGCVGVVAGLAALIALYAYACAHYPDAFSRRSGHRIDVDKLPASFGQAFPATIVLTAVQFVLCMAASRIAQWRAEHPR